MKSVILRNLFYRNIISQKNFFVCLKLSKHKKYYIGTENKSLPLLLFRGLWVLYVRCRYDDQSRNRSTAVCGWDYIGDVRSYWSNSSRERERVMDLAPPLRLDAVYATISISILYPAAYCAALTLYLAGKQTLHVIFYFEFKKFADKRRSGNVRRLPVSWFIEPWTSRETCVINHEETITREYIFCLHGLFIK